MKTARPPLPPFNTSSALLKVRAAENAWNSKKPEAISHAYSENSVWRTRSQVIHGREEIITYLTKKWQKELDYRLIKELWSFSGNRIAVRFACEYRTQDNQWFRAHGNENWEFDGFGLMQKRFACINDLPIKEDARLLVWDGDKRPKDFPSLSELGL
ncbi:DUF1348 domain-containing protein [Psychromonas sp. B3M02]|uniref:nuclear transport factor 2 family protein n=1 Tax=Psychromonas sp. B3M02 TaxID=2267226 RepID=UPI000DE9AA1D|nr:nuclear transport factor 2 family protein [Psychromonas sp. B3M02]RBW43919.1 DUF1348 domain-containing protein [Psychromonas sp. B3M02]